MSKIEPDKCRAFLMDYYFYFDYNRLIFSQNNNIGRKEMGDQINFVSIHKKPNIHFNGLSISYVLECEDGMIKTLGVLRPSEKPLTFQAHVNEVIEIVHGNCRVKVGEEIEFEHYAAGERFTVLANQRFSMWADEVVDYICHLDAH